MSSKKSSSRKRGRKRAPAKKKLVKRKPKPSIYPERVRALRRQRVRRYRDKKRVRPYVERVSTRREFIPPLANLEKILLRMPKPELRKLRRLLEEKEE